MGRYERSLELLERARLLTPEATQTSSKGPRGFVEGAFPVFIECGEGAYVWDLDGNKYLDMICSLAAMTLGYGRAEIIEAVSRQVASGSLFSLPHRLESEVAEKFLAQVASWAESVRWVKTGSEACESAVRIARMETGRDIILNCGYHGWHSAFVAVKPQHPGVPEDYAHVIVDFPYNDLPALDALLERCGTDVAAIIVEPALHDIPQPGWLQGIRDRCDRIGALMISDELICAMRWAVGGGAEYFGVMPDLATYGKAIGGGIPIAAIAGKRELMRHARLISSTFGGDILGLAACSAVLDIYKTEPIIDTLWERGRQFQDGVNGLAVGLGVPAVCDGFAVKPIIRFAIDDHLDRADYIKDRKLAAMSLFVQELAAHGVLWHPAGGNVSAAMTEADIADALDAVRGSLITVKAALDTGNWSALKGKLIQQSSFVRGKT